MGLGLGISGILGIAKGIVTSITKGLGVIGIAEGLKIIGTALMGIAKALGIIKPERKVEDLGDRAMQAEEKGMSPEDYPSYEAWVKAIEEDDWGYDPEKNKDISIEEKAKRGLEVTAAVTLEKMPETLIVDFFEMAGKNKEFFIPERLDEIGKIAVNDNDSFENIIKYLTGIEKDHTVIDNTTDILMDIEKTISPDISDREAYAKVASYRKVIE